ncbi:MAG: hypothetical protein A2X85_17475 [Geobacteraceae bacterium GWF2_54_21]|nr:MAG: hypothetical protein A2X85_17475 [Geobacteraceae bacterium GWF2_54_21]
MKAWAQFPTKWILQNKDLNQILWRQHKSNGIAALLVLIALVVKRNVDKIKGPSPDDASTVIATYNDIQKLVTISRSKVSKGLTLLTDLNIIERVEANRSNYRLHGVVAQGEWAMLPQEHLMLSGRISAFDAFNLRSQSELDALKIYLLMVAFRNTKSGYAHIGFNKITEYTGVSTRNLKKAKSHLISLGLIHADSDTENVQVGAHPPLRYKILGF